MRLYMTIPEAAILWKMKPEIIRHACETHKINGAVRFGRSWWIPKKIKPLDCVQM